MFKGSMVALVTPMHVNGTIDQQALHDLLEWHIQAGTQAIVIAGTTGESATINTDEHYELISFAVKQAAKRVPIIAGTGTNATNTTIKLTESAKKAGADACLVVTPYYNRPTQQGLFEHFKTLAETVDLPIILYNVPGRTGCDMQPETIERLSRIKHIIAVKEATGNLERAKDIIQRCDKSFEVYSGDDATALDLMLLGAKGVISVTANVAPQKMQAMCEAALAGDKERAAQLNAELMPLHTSLMIETNPIPSKWALEQMGKIAGGIRMPLLPLDKQYHPKVKEAMQKAGVV